MFGKVISECETLSTLRAGERFTMNPPVTVEQRLIGKAFPAHRTRERLIVGVKLQVPVKNGLGGIKFPALRARKRLIVRENSLLILIEDYLIPKTLPTFGTGIWFLLGVRSLMFQKTALPRKAFATFRTFKQTLAGVNPLVLGALVKLCPSLSGLVRPVFAVGEPMPEEIGLHRKTSSAFKTNVRQLDDVRPPGLRETFMLRQASPTIRT